MDFDSLIESSKVESEIFEAIIHLNRNNHQLHYLFLLFLLRYCSSMITWSRLDFNKTHQYVIRRLGDRLGYGNNQEKRNTTTTISIRTSIKEIDSNYGSQWKESRQKKTAKKMFPRLWTRLWTYWKQIGWNLSNQESIIDLDQRR